MNKNVTPQISRAYGFISELKLECITLELKFKKVAGHFGITNRKHFAQLSFSVITLLIRLFSLIR